jgi:raffinose/stachyose/melibiose transport system permease protein
VSRVIAPRTADADRRTRNGQLTLALLTIPALLVFVVFAVAPLGGVLALSFTRWDGLGAISWAGLDNWARILAEPATLDAIGTTLKVIVLSVLFQTPVSLLLGVFTAGIQRYRAALAVAFFVPILLSSAAVAIIFIALLDPNFGVTGAFPLPQLRQDWLGNPQLALIVVVFVLSWQHIPFHTLIFQGGVRQIPAVLYEAASLDGANVVQQFFSVTLPQLKYTIITSVTLLVVGTLTYFDLIFVLTGGGPGTATTVLPLAMYVAGFRANDMGGAAVLGVLLAVFGLALALGIQRLGGRDRRASQLEGAA